MTKKIKNNCSTANESNQNFETIINNAYILYSNDVQLQYCTTFLASLPPRFHRISFICFANPFPVTSSCYFVSLPRIFGLNTCTRARGPLARNGFYRTRTFSLTSYTISVTFFGLRTRSWTGSVSMCTACRRRYTWF